MTTEEKLDLIVALLEETSNEFQERADKIKDLDLPLYRMLTEGGVYYLNHMKKGLITSNQIETFKTRLRYADSLIK